VLPKLGFVARQIDVGDHQTRAPGRSRRRFGFIIVAALFALVLAHPSAALAGTASVSGPTFFYSASSGEPNNVTASLTASGIDATFTISDQGATVTAGSGCASVTGHEAVCSATGWSSNIVSFNIATGDLNDSVVITDAPATNDIGNGISGEGGDDTLMGGPGADGLNGGDGNDVLRGGAGLDNLSGGAGDDALNGGEGNDNLRGGLGADAMSGGPGQDFAFYAFDGHTADVTLTLDDNPNDGSAVDGPAGARDNIKTDVENVQGGEGNDTITGDGGDNVLDGFSGNDTLNGGGGDDHLNGSAGDDVLNGDEGDDTFLASFDEGADTMNGGAGVDFADYTGRGSPLTVDLDGEVGDDGAAGEHDSVGADVEDLSGGDDNDTLTGNTGANTIFGGPGEDTIHGLGDDDYLVGDEPPGSNGFLVANDSDTLDGGDGNDLLDGGRYPDAISGGAGFDTVDYSSRTEAVTVTLDGSPTSGSGLIDGAPGARDAVATDVEGALGGSGDDTLIGNASDNVLDGGEGDDVLDGDAGADDLIGGPGIGDAVDYSSRTDPVTVNLDGTPTSGNADDGSAGARDTVETDIEDAIGGSGADRFVGNESDNVFDGGPGADTFNGGDGFDAVDYSSRSEAVNVSLDGTANDGAAGESDNVGAGMEDAFGGSGDDHITGNEASNLFAGGAGADVLDGAGGDDFLIGESGADSLTGGPGSDLFDGGDDNDSIQSRDGVVDDVFCGAGTDGVVADLTDSTFDCETVHRGPPLVTTGAATELTETNVTLSGTVNPAGQGATVYVQIGTTTAYGTQSSGLSLPAAVADYGITSKWSNLQPGTTYHYRFLATNADGTTYGADQAFTTAGTVSGADVGLTISDAPDPVAVGKQITYALTVTNNGPGSAAIVTVRDPLPPGLVLVSASASQGTCTNAAPVRCDLGSLASGASATVKIVARPKATGKISNTATVSSTTPDLATTNNSASAATTVSGPPCVVPNVKRKTLGAAKKAITRAHCTLGKVRTAYSPRVGRGRVIAQRPAPRARLRFRGRVNLIVSRGPRH
jgi:uncharacterized repeat protein (TIGR01451 family)